jgi:hypothetical protein
MIPPIIEELVFTIVEILYPFGTIIVCPTAITIGVPIGVSPLNKLIIEPLVLTKSLPII